MKLRGRRGHKPCPKGTHSAQPNAGKTRALNAYTEGHPTPPQFDSAQRPAFGQCEAITSACHLQTVPFGMDHVFQMSIVLCYHACMTNSKATKRKTTKGMTIGRAAAAKLNAVEGISMSPETQRAFAEFDRLGLSADQRRHRLMKQFGTRSG